MQIIHSNTKLITVAIELVHRTVSRLSVHLNFHVYILFVVVFTLVGQLVAGNDLLACL